ncbi:MAG: 3-deoxy-7-phosphoheptulonate synthase [Alphaproteobacteria bacterium]|nr:3-deoxy-7-phosphoheptulonate synthase [Alphaproteobacteria bacterium]
MIIVLNEKIDEVLLQKFLASHPAQILTDQGKKILVSSGAMTALPEEYRQLAKQTFAFKTDIQLADNSYIKRRTIKVGDITLGDGASTVMIAGPCSVENRDQIFKTAEHVGKLGVRFLRAGAFKPRTSPYSFQGLGRDGLKQLREAADHFGMKVVTETRDATQVDQVIDLSDIIQIGAKAMYDHGILRAVGGCGKPVLLKRHFGATLQEFVQSAEFVLSGGNPQVILCERGIRSFETKTRFTLDLCGVAFIKQHLNLPVFIDPSHAMGYAYGVPDLTRAAMAMGVDGLLIEVHPAPKLALSDASQQLTYGEFSELYNSLKPVAAAVGRVLI